MKRLFFLFILGTTAACATVSNIETGLRYLEGESIDTAVLYLGDPDNYLELVNSRIYTWSNSETLNLVLPSTTTSSGYSSSGEYVSLTNYGTTTSSSDLNCKLTLRTDNSGVIKSSKVEGDFMSCSVFSKRVKNIPKPWWASD